jgi:flagellar motility protein MotE (MotC chaperone)
MTARMPKRSWSAGRGALLVVASLLLLSALVRLGAGSGAAIALEIQSARAAAADGDVELVDISPELVALLEETRERERALDAREADIEARMQALALVESAVAEDLSRLEAAEKKLRQTISDANSAAENDITRLTSVYENMKPEQAAALFEQMEPSFAAGFLGRMRADLAAAILAGLEPGLAYSISVELAGRNAGVPREDLPEADAEMPEG